EHTTENAQNDMQWIFPSSYWYPPVFWMLPQRFRPTTARIAQLSPLNPYWVQRNKQSDIVAPGQKVQLFENKEYDHPIQPMGNEPFAKPLCAIADGSAKPVRIADIISRTDPAGTQPNMLKPPWANFDYGDALMTGGQYEYGSNQGFNWTFGK